MGRREGGKEGREGIEFLFAAVNKTSASNGDSGLTAGLEPDVCDVSGVLGPGGSPSLLRVRLGWNYT